MIYSIEEIAKILGYASKEAARKFLDETGVKYLVYRGRVLVSQEAINEAMGIDTRPITYLQEPKNETPLIEF